MTRDETASKSSPPATGTTPDREMAPSETPGHYGPGYGEPVKHEGDDDALPTSPRTDASATSTPARSTLLSAGETPAGAMQPGGPGATGSAPNAPRTAQQRGGEGRVDFAPEDVHSRPPIESPSKSAPTSENVSLGFERS